MIKYLGTEEVTNDSGLARFELEIPFTEEDQAALKAVLTGYPGYTERYAETVIQRVVATTQDWRQRSYTLAVVVLSGARAKAPGPFIRIGKQE